MIQGISVSQIRAPVKFCSQELSGNVRDAGDSGAIASP